MTKEDLLKDISTTLHKTRAGKLAKLLASEQGIANLLELTFYPKKEIAFRAAWVLEILYFEQPLIFHSHLTAFNTAYCRQQNLSCQRHYTKIMMALSSPRNDVLIKTGILQIDFEPVVETTFEWLVHPRTPVAVQANCLDILYHLSDRYDWISDELILQTQFLLRNGSAAIQSRGRRILTKLERKSISASGTLVSQSLLGK